MLLPARPVLRQALFELLAFGAQLAVLRADLAVALAQRAPLLPETLDLLAEAIAPLLALVERGARGIARQGMLGGTAQRTGLSVDQMGTLGLQRDEALLERDLSLQIEQMLALFAVVTPFLCQLLRQLLLLLLQRLQARGECRDLGDLLLRQGLQGDQLLTGIIPPLQGGSLAGQPGRRIAPLPGL